MKPLLSILLLLPVIVFAGRYKNVRNTPKKSVSSHAMLMDDKWQESYTNRAKVLIDALQNLDKKLEYFRKVGKLEMNKESLMEGAQNAIKSIMEGKDKVTTKYNLSTLRNSLNFDGKSSSLESREKMLELICKKWQSIGLIAADYKPMVGWDLDGTKKDMNWCFPKSIQQSNDADQLSSKEDNSNIVPLVPVDVSQDVLEDDLKEPEMIAPEQASFDDLMNDIPMIKPLEPIKW